jgi:hypothetical protein
MLLATSSHLWHASRNIPQSVMGLPLPGRMGRSRLRHLPALFSGDPPCRDGEFRETVAYPDFQAAARGYRVSYAKMPGFPAALDLFERGATPMLRASRNPCSPPRHSYWHETHQSVPPHHRGEPRMALPGASRARVQVSLGRLVSCHDSATRGSAPVRSLRGSSRPAVDFFARL